MLKESMLKESPPQGHTERIFAAVHPILAKRRQEIREEKRSYLYWSFGGSFAAAALTLLFYFRSNQNSNSIDEEKIALFSEDPELLSELELLQELELLEDLDILEEWNPS